MVSHSLHNIAEYDLNVLQDIEMKPYIDRYHKIVQKFPGIEDFSIFPILPIYNVW